MSTRRIAALDVGSNTVHLLVADAGHRTIREVEDDLTMPRVGRAVQATGAVGAEKLAEVVADVGRFAARARELGAERLLFCATEAMRQAGDRDAALSALADAAGVPCVLISPQAEARLSFRGATSDAPLDGGLTLVVDIGGGSTECVVGEAGRIVALASLPVGSGAATERWLTDDPPGSGQRTSCAAGIREVLAAAPEALPDCGIAVGGTATTLPMVLDRPERTGELDGEDLARIRHRLARHTSAEVAEDHGIDPVRARVLAGGLEVLAAVCERYALRSVRVSDRGLRHGMVLAFLDNAEGWPEG